MPKSAVETAVCDVCGVVVREGSLFCYNCGGPISKAAEVTAIPVPSEPITAPAEKPANGNSPYDPATRRSERVEKRRVRPAKREPVEIVWQPRTGFSWPFVIVSLVFVMITLVVVIVAFYFR